jgi:S-adenosylmethionine/arginine decarboxylase-like enzyme
MKKIFGYELIMDLKDCNVKIMNNKRKLQEYVDRLCELIEMKKYGKCLLEYFGTNKEHTKGYSLMQFIETSSITGHFSEYWEKAYINIFSCQPYNKELAVQFTKEFFEASKIKFRYLVR